MAKKVFTDESLATLVNETKLYVDDAVSTKADSNHTHTIDNVTDLQTELDTINSELDGSIKELSVSGKVITYTKNDGTTGTITTQDTNTTYANVDLGQGYGTCSTAASTTAKTATLSGYTLKTGGIVSIKFTYAVPASATLNINSKGEKSIYYKGSKITSNVIKAGDIATFIYNGSYYHLISIDRWANDIKTLQADLSGKADDEHTHLVEDITDLTATSTELNYMSGVTSGVQVQLDCKVPIKEVTETYISSYSNNISISLSDLQSCETMTYNNQTFYKASDVELTLDDFRGDWSIGGSYKGGGFGEVIGDELFAGEVLPNTTEEGYLYEGTMVGSHSILVIPNSGLWFLYVDADNYISQLDLSVSKFPQYTTTTVRKMDEAYLPAPTESTMGGILASKKEETDTVEVKLGEDKKLYVPAYEHTHEIGGRNYLQNSDVEKYYETYIPWFASMSLTENGFMKVTPKADATSAGFRPQLISNLERNTEYTLSFEAYADTALTLNYNFIMCGSGNKMLNDAIFNLTTTPIRFTYTFITESVYNDCSFMFAYENTAGANIPFYIRGMQIEKGNMTTDWHPAPEDFTNEIDAIQIGGRNLLLYSEYSKDSVLRNYYAVNLNSTPIREFADGARHFTTHATEGSSNGNGEGIYFGYDVGVKAGDVLTFSFDAKGTKGTYNKFAMSYSSDGVEGEWNNRTILCDLSDLSPTEYKRYSATFVMPTLASESAMAHRKSCNLYLLMGFGAEVWFKNLKLEKGNKATDWTPAPEEHAVDVGGANLLLKTNQGITSWGYTTNNGVTSVEELIEEDRVSGVKLVCTTAGSSYGYATYALGDTLLKLRPNTRYTLSFDVKTNVTDKLSFDLMTGAATARLLKSGAVTDIIAGDEKWHSCKVDLITNDLSSGISGQVLYIGRMNAVGYRAFKNLKMEKGSVATDWTPAFEDLNEGAVLYTPQTLTDDEKAQARINIGALSEDEVLESSGDGDTLTWDGNTEGLVCAMDILYLVSSVTPALEELQKGCQVTLWAEGSEYTISCTAEQLTEQICLIGGYILIVYEDNADFDGIIIPEKGIYYPSEGVDLFYTKSLTINGYTGFKTTTKQIKEEYLPILEEVGGDTLTWDGNTDGLHIIEDTYVHISDVVPTMNDLSQGGTISFAPSEIVESLLGVSSLEFSGSDVYEDGLLLILSIANAGMMIVQQEFESDGFIFKKGIYFIITPYDGDNNMIYVSSFTINGYTGFKQSKIKEEYLPDMELITIEDIDEICGSSIVAASDVTY